MGIPSLFVTERWHMFELLVFYYSEIRFFGLI